MKTTLLLFIVFQTLNSYCQISDSLKYVIIDRDEKCNIISCSDSTKRHIQKEFKLAKDDPSKYSIVINEDSISLLFININNTWKILDTIDKSLTLYSDIFCNIWFPYFEKTDFNKDGYIDLIVPMRTNVNGNLWTKIYLFNPKCNELQPIYSSEDTSQFWTSGIWSAPEYNQTDSTINCTNVSGAYGLFFTSKYKLHNFMIEPIEKNEDDTRAVDRRGNGALHRRYIGKDGKWILIETNKIKN